jgi:kinetochore protein NDC80
MWGGATGPLLGVNQTVKDPRPVREKSFQQQISRTIISFLTSANCPIQLSPKMSSSPPTSQQYWAVVDWLIHQLDPIYPEGKGGAPAVGPTDYIAVLKWLRYPYADAIDKKSLTTVGGLHTWPHLLAALHYLVCLCQVCCISLLPRYTNNMCRQ